MARCMICGRKIPGTQPYCGKKSCENLDDIIPRCIKCNGLVYDGKEKCPVDKQPCIVAEGNEIHIPTKAKYLEKVI